MFSFEDEKVVGLKLSVLLKKKNCRSYCFLLFGVMCLSGSLAEFRFFFLYSYQFANVLLDSLDCFVFLLRLINCRIDFYSFIIAENLEIFSCKLLCSCILLPLRTI